jgi:DNA-binding beta-propeller fold protein YncE
MANDKNFVIKNGLQAGRYLQTGGTETAGSVGYNLAGAEYDSVSFSVASQDNIPTALVFNTDGTKLYVGGTQNETIYQYTLSTAFDVSTASYDSVSFSVSGQESNLQGFRFNNDGTKMYVCGGTNDTVYQYTLATAFNLSTAFYDSVSFSLSGQATNPYDVLFNNVGTKMYIADAGSDAIYQYSLSTAFDLSSASYDSVSISVSSIDTAPSGIDFNGDGTKIYMLGLSSDAVHEYNLSTPFDLSTASYAFLNFSVLNQGTAPQGFVFSSDGTKMYVVDAIGDAVFQYSTVAYTQTLDLSTGTYFSFTPSGATTVSFTNAPASGKAVGFAVEINGDGSAITWPSSVKWHEGIAPTATASKEVYAFVTVDGGTSYYGKLAGSDIA